MFAADLNRSTQKSLPPEHPPSTSNTGLQPRAPSPTSAQPSDSPRPLAGRASTAPEISLKTKIMDAWYAFTSKISFCKDDLVTSIMHGNIDRARGLLHRGIYNPNEKNAENAHDINAKNFRTNTTPLMEAYNRTNIPLIELLLRKGASGGSKTLCDAIRENKIALATTLVRKGLVDPSELEDPTGSSPLQLAVRRAGNPTAEDGKDFIKFLIGQGAKLGIADPNYAEASAFDYAVDQGLYVLASELLEESGLIDLNPNSIHNQNSFKKLMKSNKKEARNIIDKMIKKEFPIDLMDNEGRTAIYYAFKKGDEKRALELAKQGALFLTRSDPKNLLIAAMNLGWKDVAEQFIANISKLERPKQESYVNLRDEAGNSNLHIACQKNYEKIAKALLAFGADAVAQNHKGQDPFEMAMGSSNYKLALKLLTCAFDQKPKKQQDALEKISSLQQKIQLEKRDPTEREENRIARLKREADPKTPLHLNSPLIRAYQLCIADQKLVAAQRNFDIAPKPNVAPELDIEQELDVVLQFVDDTNDPSESDKAPSQDGTTSTNIVKLYESLAQQSSGERTVDTRTFLFDLIEHHQELGLDINQIEVKPEPTLPEPTLPDTTLPDTTLLKLAISEGDLELVEKILENNGTVSESDYEFALEKKKFQIAGRLAAHLIQNKGGSNAPEILNKIPRLEGLDYQNFLEGLSHVPDILETVTPEDEPNFDFRAYRVYVMSTLGKHRDRMNRYFVRAADRGDMSLINFLRNNGLNIITEKQQHTRRTVLHLAAVNGRRNVIAGLDPETQESNLLNVQDVNSNTALHLAAFFQHKNAVEALLEQGADIHAKGLNGNTALHLAVIEKESQESLAIVELLIKAGADRNATNNDGKNPLGLIDKETHPNTYALLESPTQYKVKSTANAIRNRITSMASIIAEVVTDFAKPSSKEKVKKK